jgi:hypothetical protein
MRYSMRVSEPSEEAARGPADPVGTVDPGGLAVLFRLAKMWRDKVDAPARRAAVAIGVGSVFGLAHLARLGSPAARIASGATLIVVWAGLVVRAIVSRNGSWFAPS